MNATVSGRQPRGYVLVVTLGLLVISTTLLVAVGRAAVRHALAAREVQERLQRKWGAASCRSAALPYAERILSRLEAREHRPVAAVRARVRLGAGDVDLIVADEQAKANVNALLESARSDRSSVESRLRLSLAGAGLSNAVRLHPSTFIPTSTTKPGTTQPGDRPAGVPRWVSGWGQVLENVPPDRLLGRGVIPPPADRITCWGPGGINILRASEAALTLATSPSLSQLDIGRLIDARNARYKPRISSGEIFATPANETTPPSADPLAALLAEAKVGPRDRARLPLTAGSSCHSLWIVFGGDRRAFYSLIILDESNPQQPRTESFVW